MIITEGTPLGSKTVIKDGDGNLIKKVKSFDTETKEAEVYATLLVGDGYKTATRVIKGNTTSYIQKEGEGEIEGEVVTFKCHLRGCKAYDKNTGKEII